MIGRSGIPTLGLLFWGPVSESGQIRPLRGPEAWPPIQGLRKVVAELLPASASTAGSPETALPKEVVSGFLEETEALLARMKEPFTPEEWQEACHQLRGALLVVAEHALVDELKHWKHGGSLEEFGLKVEAVRRKWVDRG